MRDWSKYDTKSLELLLDQMTGFPDVLREVKEEMEKRENGDTPQRKQFTCTVEKAPAGMDERVLRFIGSTPAEDRDGDTIDVAGWELDNFKTNPVFLWAHNPSIPPIGKAVNVMSDTVNQQLVFDIKFASMEELGDSEHAKFCEAIYQMYKHGYMSATSVGFIGKQFEYKTDDKGKPTWGKHFTKQELFELSAVPVPSNPTALVQARGVLGEDMVAKCFGSVDKKAYKMRLDRVDKSIVLVSENGEVAEFVADSCVKSNLFYLYDLLLSDDIEKALVEKAGATLNRKNRDKLEQASELIQSVLASAMTEETQEGSKGLDVEKDTHEQNTNGNGAQGDDDEFEIVDDTAEEEFVIIED